MTTKDSYAAAKEAFVSGHNGSTPAESALILSNTAVFLLLHGLLVIRGWIPGACKPGFCGPPLFSSSVFVFIVEVLFIIVPNIVAFSIELETLKALVAVSATTAFVLLVTESRRPVTVKEQLCLINARDLRRPFFITCFRASVILGSSLCILAVDFPVFPRRYAKTELRGTALMDLGVTSFIVASGLVSRSAKRTSAGGKGVDVGHVLRSNTPLVILGFVRLIAHRALGYHVHVTEYGAHWNFFFTVSLVNIIANLIDTLLVDRLSGILSAYTATRDAVDYLAMAWIGLGFAIIAVYQFSLVYLPIPLWLGPSDAFTEDSHEPPIATMNLGNYIFYARRQEKGIFADFFAQNREGICGVAGFLSVHCFAVGIARAIGVHPRRGGGKDGRMRDGQSVNEVQKWEEDRDGNEPKYGEENHEKKKRKEIGTWSGLQVGNKETEETEPSLLMLGLFCCLFWVAYFASWKIGGSVASRRQVNASFVFWSLAQQLTSAMQFAMMERWFRGRYHSLLFNAFNANMLAVFMGANLSTGLVNVLTDTIHYRDESAIFILLMHGTAVSAMACCLYLFRPHKCVSYTRSMF